MRKTASTTFIITRLLADGVRLFATAIPLTIIFRFAGAFESWGDMELYLLAITIISLISLIYTFMGGIKAEIGRASCRERMKKFGGLVGKGTIIAIGLLKSVKKAGRASKNVD